MLDGALVGELETVQRALQEVCKKWERRRKNDSHSKKRAALVILVTFFAIFTFSADSTFFLKIFQILLHCISSLPKYFFIGLKLKPA